MKLYYKVPTEDSSYIYGLSTAQTKGGGTSCQTHRLLRVDVMPMNIVVQPGQAPHQEDSFG